MCHTVSAAHSWPGNGAATSKQVMPLIAALPTCQRERERDRERERGREREGERGMIFPQWLTFPLF